MDNEVKQESVAQVTPDPASEPNQSTKETEGQIDSEPYLYENFAKVLELLVLLRQSRSKKVRRRCKRDKELARAQRRLHVLEAFTFWKPSRFGSLHVLEGQILEALLSAQSL